jgi:hypothetical protein
MPAIFDGVRSYVKWTRGPAAIAPGDSYRRGYLQGLRHHHSAGQSGAQDTHARWLVSRDSPEHAEFDRGFRDGFAGIKPRP